MPRRATPMLSSLFRRPSREASSKTNHPFHLRFEPLEERTVLSAFSLLQTFNNPTPVAGDIFGVSVAMSGNNVLLAAQRDDTGATDAGSAYLFDASSGNLRQTFNNPTPAVNDFFFRVAISGNDVLVGAQFDETGGPVTGSAYVLDATTGNLRQTIINPTPGFRDFFGVSVAISGNTAVIGALEDDTGATNAGSAYLFDTNTGNLLQTFNNPTAAENDFFGISVASSGNFVLVGASSDDTGATNAGSAYLFNSSTGSLLQTFNNPTPAEGDRFGISVAISGSKLLMGAAFDDTGATNAGSAYLFGVQDPAQLIPPIIADIESLNLPPGLENSLVAKLEAAKKKLEDGNPNNDHAALNKMNAFINEVEALHGTKINDLDADALIADAEFIIEILEAGLEPAI